MNTVASLTPDSQLSPGTSGKEGRPRRDHRLGGRIRVLRLARAVVVGLAMVACPLSAVRAQLWDNNDYIVANTIGFVILDENFQFKRFINDFPITLTGWGSLDWFGNGDVMLGKRTTASAESFLRVRCDINGNCVYEGAYCHLVPEQRMPSSHRLMTGTCTLAVLATPTSERYELGWAPSTNPPSDTGAA